MSDSRDPHCPYGGTLLERGTMDCPRYKDRPHVGVCASCLASGGVRPAATVAASPEALLIADCLGICDACGDGNCILKLVSPCARRGMMLRRSTRCPADRWRLPPPTAL